MAEQPAQVQTPVAIIVFNRPELAARVFECVRRVRPKTLLVIADGPRPDRPGEAEKCAAARAATEQIDWPCDVRRNYSEVNLGCARRMRSGIDWVFDQFEEAIILEDDIVPLPSFFHYCQTMLERYRDDERIMHIGGCSLQRGLLCSDDPYFFTKYIYVWGWATWRRAWRHNDFNMDGWPSFHASGDFRKLCLDGAEAAFWRGIFDKRQRLGQPDSWAYPWTFSCWAKQGLAIAPAYDLVENIGFGGDATHTKDSRGAPTFLPRETWDWDARPEVKRNLDSERFTFLYNYHGASFKANRTPVGLLKRVARKVRRELAARVRVQARGGAGG